MLWNSDVRIHFVQTSPTVFSGLSFLYLLQNFIRGDESDKAGRKLRPENILWSNPKKVSPNCVTFRCFPRNKLSLPSSSHKLLALIATTYDKLGCNVCYERISYAATYGFHLRPTYVSHSTYRTYTRFMC